MAGIEVGWLVVGSEVVGVGVVGDDVAGAEETGAAVGADVAGAYVAQSPSHEPVLQKLFGQSATMPCHAVVYIPSPMFAM